MAVKHVEIEAVAGAAMPYGSPVKEAEDGRMIPARLELNQAGNPVPGADDDLLDMRGVLCRPAMTQNFSHCAEGDRIKVKTDGEIRADVQTRLVMFTLVGGKPIERA